MNFSPALDLFPLLAALLAALSCALLGNFLVLRRQGLLGDAISHAVLPGLVAAFLITGGRSPTAMLIGAAAAGLLTVLLAEVVQRLGKVEPGAALGVVFSLMFALGVLLIEQAAARDVDLDADCVLYGQLETLVWFGAPATFGEVFSADGWRATWDAVPRQVWMLLAVFVASAVFVGALFKELRVTCFDPELASSQGISSRAMHVALMVLVASATVASFEAVGSILVIAMLIAPAACARLLTDRLWSQVSVSLLAGAVAAVGGYVGASALPNALGVVWSGRSWPAVNAAGSVVLVAGVLVAGAAFLSPSHGLVVKRWRQRVHRKQTALDDLLLTLLRAAQRGGLSVEAGWSARTLARAAGLGLVEADNEGSALPRLTTVGRLRAMELLRRHRLWETYLVHDAGLAADHVHEPAEQLEHLPTRMVPGLSDPTRTTDPHGQPLEP